MILVLRLLKPLQRVGKQSQSRCYVGLGETEEELFETMDDLINVGCKILTIGQYLQPQKASYVKSMLRQMSFEI